MLDQVDLLTSVHAAGRRKLCLILTINNLETNLYVQQSLSTYL